MRDLSLSSDLPATRTSLLKALEDDAREQNLIALGVFYERYRKGLANYLTSRFGLESMEANDILHDFLYEKMVDASLIHSYLNCLRQSKPGHRAFRPYLVRSLCNFTIDRLRKRSNHVSMDPTPKEDALVSEYADLYTLQWVQDILANTFQRTRFHYVNRHRQQDWILFVVRWIEPLVMSKSPPTYDELAAQFGFDHSKQVGNILTNVLRTFKQKWKEALAEDVGSDDKQAIADALRDARLAMRMVRYIDFSQLLTQALQKGVQSPASSDLEQYRVDESTYRGILDLATDGFEQLLPIEKALLFESHLRMPINHFLKLDSAFDGAPAIADKHLEDILADPAPNPDCLEFLAKQLKRSIRSECTTVPPSIAGVLRFALIAFADATCNRSITSVSQDELAKAMSDVVNLPWIDVNCRNLIQSHLIRHAPSSSVR